MTILVVCTANVARSPLAEVMLAASVDAEVVSAGTQARTGDAAAVRSQELAAMRGLDLTRHRSTPLRPDAIELADLVITMSEAHRDHCGILVPEAAVKVFTLRELVRLLPASDADGAEGRTHRPVSSSPAELAARAHAGRSTGTRSRRSEDVHDPIQDPWSAWVKMGTSLDQLLTEVVAALGHRPGWTPAVDAPGHDGTNRHRWWRGRSTG